MDSQDFSLTTIACEDSVIQIPSEVISKDSQDFNLTTTAREDSVIEIPSEVINNLSNASPSRSSSSSSSSTNTGSSLSSKGQKKKKVEKREKKFIIKMMEATIFMSFTCPLAVLGMSFIVEGGKLSPKDFLGQYPVPYKVFLIGVMIAFFCAVNGIMFMEESAYLRRGCSITALVGLILSFTVLLWWLLPENYGFLVWPFFGFTSLAFVYRCATIFWGPFGNVRSCFFRKSTLEEIKSKGKKVELTI